MKSPRTICPFTFSWWEFYVDVLHYRASAWKEFYFLNELEITLFVSHSPERVLFNIKSDGRIKTNLILYYRCHATRAKSEQSLSLVFSMQNVKKQKQWSLKEPTDLCRSAVRPNYPHYLTLNSQYIFSFRAKIGGSRNLSGEISYLMKPTDSYLKTNWPCSVRFLLWQTASISVVRATAFR